VASIRAEGEALARKLAEVEKDRDRVRSDAARREETQLAVIEEQRQRADQLERDIAARTEHEARLTDEWTLLRAQQSERIALLEASAIAAENAQSDLLAQRSDAERALALMQAERDRLVTRLAEIARDRDLAPAAAAGGEQGPSAEPLKTEAAAPAEAAAEGDGRPVEAWEASRAELMARIAQLEAQEVISDKARTELLNRKRDSDQALAAAQAERAVLLKKLAVAEHDRDPARAVAESFEEDRKEPETRSVPTAPAGAQGVSGRHDTGGLSALVSRWDTGVTRRPFRSKVVEQKSPDPPVDEGSEPEVIATESAASSGAAPAPERERQPKPDRPAPGGPARPNPPRRPAPKPAPASDKANQSGGWLQGLTTRILRKP
jgi:hypothetical protein